MLKRPSPNRRRKVLGSACLVAGMAGASGLLYAATAVPSSAKSTTDPGYQLNVVMRMGDQISAEPIVCVASGEQGEIMQHGDRAPGGRSALWDVRLIATPAAHGQVQVSVHGTMYRDGNTDKSIVFNPTMRGPFGQAMVIKVMDSLQSPVQWQITPTVGCSALQQEAHGRKIDAQWDHIALQLAAESIASKAGLVLMDADALKGGAVTLHATQIPADAALQLVAGLANMKPVYASKGVMFVPK